MTSAYAGTVVPSCSVQHTRAISQHGCDVLRCPEANSEGEGTRVCSPHGITTDQRAVVPSLPRHDPAEHATEPIGLFPHL